MKRWGMYAAIIAAMMVTGCASGPKLADVQASLPKTPADRGRIYFYRTSILGTAIQPGIYLNGQSVGSCVPDGVFFRDVAPGDYQARVSTEVERQLTFTISPGEEKFVRCYISFGVLVGRGNLELVDPAEGRSDIQNLSYTGGAEG